jgi:protein-S-isoprenylcysteine O-methyltransferase Ste14
MAKIYRWRVRTALIILPIVLVLARPVPFSIAAGICLCATGLGIRAWAAGHIKKEKELAVSGPYRYTRNPLYLGNFILGSSVAVGANSWWDVLLLVVYFGLFYPPVLIEEHRRMRRLFPEEYEEYKKRVPLFFPTSRPSSNRRGARFSLALYRRNREYRALVGAVIIWGLMICKMLIF